MDFCEIESQTMLSVSEEVRVTKIHGSLECRPIFGWPTYVRALFDGGAAAPPLTARFTVEKCSLHEADVSKIRPSFKFRLLEVRRAVETGNRYFLTWLPVKPEMNVSTRHCSETSISAEHCPREVRLFMECRWNRIYVVRVVLLSANASEYGRPTESRVSEVCISFERRARKICIEFAGEFTAIEPRLSTEFDIGEEQNCSEVSIGEKGVFRETRTPPVRSASELAS